jgi:type IV secretion system protein VirB4
MDLDGPNAWLFDNDEDRFDLTSRMIGCDMTAILEDPALRTPALLYLFHRIDEGLDGSPTMILIDEGWKALDDEIFAARIRDWLKTLRKRNAMVGLVTRARDAWTADRQRDCRTDRDDDLHPQPRAPRIIATAFRITNWR